MAKKSPASLRASSEKYMTEPALQKRFTKIARAHGHHAATSTEHARWAKSLRAILRDITGFATIKTAPPRPVINQTVKLDGYTRQHMEIQTEPGVFMPFYVLKPDGDGPFPAVICPHGHASGGKLSTAGVDDNPVIAKQIRIYNYDYGRQFVKAGAIAFCPDARGFGQRIERLDQPAYEQSPLISSCKSINQMAYPLGQTVTGMWAWDILALARYIHSRKDVAPRRLACAGLSGGGLQTLWAAALDHENLIQAAVVSGYFYGYRQSLLERYANCSCNYVPHLYEHADMGDLAALFAPRPMLIETGDHDPLNGRDGVSNVKSQFNIARKAYTLLGARKNLAHDIFPGEHLWHGKIAIPWVMKHLTS